jgi:hypothetical protein
MFEDILSRKMFGSKAEGSIGKAEGADSAELRNLRTSNISKWMGKRCAEHIAYIRGREMRIEFWKGDLS